MFQWLFRLFQRKKAAPREPAMPPAELAVIPQGYDDPSEARIETRLVGRAQAKQIDEAHEMVKQSNHDLTLSQAHAVLSSKDEGPRAEMVIAPADGMAVPILPADLAPETVAVPRVPQDDAEATRRLPPLSERMGGGKNNRRRGLEDDF